MANPFELVQLGPRIPRYMKEALDGLVQDAFRRGARETHSSLVATALVKTYKLTPPKEEQASA